MNRLFKENQYTLFFIIALILGLLFLFYDKSDTQDFDVVEKGGIVEDLKIDAPTEDVVEINEPKIDTSKSLKDKFNIAIANGDETFVNKDYSQTVRYYSEALNYIESQIAYIRLFNTYNVMGETEKAMEAIDKAIELKPSITDYWITKIQFLDERTATTYAELRKIYEEGFAESKNETKVNLTTSFARISESNNQRYEAISLWEQAKTLYPERISLYQAEIDRLQTE